MTRKVLASAEEWLDNSLVRIPLTAEHLENTSPGDKFLMTLLRGPQSWCQLSSPFITTTFIISIVHVNRDNLAKDEIL
jgi:hypothetical protein